MVPSTPPPGIPPRAAVDTTTTGSFVVDEVMGNARQARPLVSIVLPAFNEAAILEDNLAVLQEYLRTLAARFRFEIIIVNDGSIDGTAKIADDLATRYANVRVFHHPTNFGLGQAFKTALDRKSVV